jgi:hypothetical protein
MRLPAQLSSFVLRARVVSRQVLKKMVQTHPDSAVFRSISLFQVIFLLFSLGIRLFF